MPDHNGVVVAEGRDVLEERGGGGAKVCVPKTAQINISFCKFHFPHYEIWVQGGGGGPKGGGGVTAPPPMVVSCLNTACAIPHRRPQGGEGAPAGDGGGWGEQPSLVIRGVGILNNPPPPRPPNE